VQGEVVVILGGSETPGLCGKETSKGARNRRNLSRGGKGKKSGKRFNARLNSTCKQEVGRDERATFQKPVRRAEGWP